MFTIILASAKKSAAPSVSVSQLVTGLLIIAVLITILAIWGNKQDQKKKTQDTRKRAQEDNANLNLKAQETMFNMLQEAVRPDRQVANDKANPESDDDYY